MSERGQSYLSRDDAVALLNRAVGFLDGLSAGLAAWNPTDRAKVCNSIDACAGELRAALQEGDTDG